MKSKYNMSEEDNIFFAKRKLVDNIYKITNLEGISITFADTYSFFNKELELQELHGELNYLVNVIMMKN